MPDFLEVCRHAALAGGEVLLSWRDRFSTREKASRDLVTDADLASQVAIREVLLRAYPDHDFLGEESDPADKVTAATSCAKKRYRWIVDPLDGTSNYVHRLQTFAVSIALEDQGRIVLGAIYDPILREFYHAEAGKGAFLNGRRLCTSNCQTPGDALIAVSFSPHVPRDSVEIRRFIEGLLACQSVRRLGSAALNLGYLAAGRLDGYWATSVHIWDVAAGILLVREAGGIVTHIGGGELDLDNPQFVASASVSLHQHMLRLLAAAESQ
jgi:myo-inositol-1(or 4)-monophosphatase